MIQLKANFVNNIVTIFNEFCHKERFFFENSMYQSPVVPEDIQIYSNYVSKST